MVESARWAADLVYAHDHDGFRCEIDVEQIRAASTAESPGNEWTFSARIDDGDISRTTELMKVWKLGSGAVVGSAVLPDATLAVVKTDNDRPLRLLFDARGVHTTAFEVSGPRVSVRPVRPTALSSVIFTAWDGSARIEAERLPDGGFTAEVPPPPEGELAAAWRLQGLLKSGEVQPLIAPAGFIPGYAPNEHGIRATVTRTGQAIVQARRSTAIVEDAALSADADIELGGYLLAMADFEVGIAPEEGSPRVWLPATVKDGHFTARIPTATSTGNADGRPLPAGKYAVFAREITPEGARAAEILLSEPAAGALPRDELTSLVKVKLIRSRGGILGVEIAAPVADAVIGRYAQAALATKYGASPRQLEDAVFFLVDVGNNAADSALAIHQELRRRGATMPLYWGVEDLSVPVPEGGIPIVKRSEEWFAKVNRSRYLVNNYGGMWGLRKDPTQRYLQTWHGTPLKYIGVSEARHRGALKPRFDQIAAEAAEWDAFVSPSPYFSALIPGEFLYHGPILETGYPRNDRLATATPDDRAAIREQFGIPPAAKVLLYAPTFRDNERRGWRAPLFDGLDLGRLLDLLGPEWTVLLRGHIFNANDNHADRTAGRLIDVTRHSDINDLYLASDVLVTDYSSVMFDYAVTGKPMAFFTPDLEEYVAGRGTYFDLREEAPGPLHVKVDELATGLLDLDGLAAHHRDRYDSFRAKFAPWDDGKAAARVIDAFFD
jgi:CDP-glycerol glycerophosphotransferase